MDYPRRDIFHNYPHFHSTERTRIAPSLPLYFAEPVSHAARRREHVPSQPETHHLSPAPAFENDLRPSLPSISNLFGIVNSDQPTRDQGAIHRFESTHDLAPDRSAEPLDSRTQKQNVLSPELPTSHQQDPSGQSLHDLNSIVQAERVPYHRQQSSSSQSTLVPPTPPYRGDSCAEGSLTPSTISTGSSYSSVRPHLVASELTNVETNNPRILYKQHSAPVAVSSQPDTSPDRTLSTEPTQITSSTSTPKPPLRPLPNTTYHGIAHQKPLPSNFPPRPPTLSEDRDELETTNPWQHHHYISSSSKTSFPPPPDRYICQTCNKAFSRPSSLKIHSHSHTGEKPFKCPHAACGKAFSVRSNMKRHERGCHARPPGFVLSASYDLMT